MMHHTSGINTEMKVNGQRPETVTIFKYLGSVKTDEGSKPETLSRIAQMTAALTRLKLIGMTGALLSVARYTRWAPLSHPSSCTLMNHGPSQQSCKEEYCLGNEVLPQDTMQFLQTSCYRQGSLCQDQHVIRPHEDLLTIIKRRRLK